LTLGVTQCEGGRGLACRELEEVLRGFPALLSDDYAE